MASGITISANFSDGQTLGQFSKTLEQRMKWMNESARDSIAATAITALRSIRAMTKVAKPSTISVNVKREGQLYCSCTTQGNARKPCLRVVGSKTRYIGNERKWFESRGVPFGNLQVFRYKDAYSRNNQEWLIVASSMGVAKNAARKISAKRAMVYSGLARRAIGFLMMKTATVNVADNVSPKVNSVALRQTEHLESVATTRNGSGGKYGLFLQDNLRYALDAIKGGKQQVDLALKKAMNKITSQINRKIKGVGFFGQKKLKTPFPELTKKRK